jgi:hypothetical protein
MKKPTLTLAALLISAAAAQAGPEAGLWVGDITVNKVSEVHARQTTGTVPTAAPAAYSMKVLLHVDAAGNVKLLKEVTLMKTRVVSPALPVPVLVTQPALIPNFDGITQRGGKLIGQRFSSAAFPMTGDTSAITGALTAGSSLTGSLTLPAANPVNPFRHKYHPDLAHAGREITRAVGITIAAGDSPSDHVLAGTWTEAVSGLHHTTIHASGQITLTRVSTVATLNNQ